MTLYIFLRQNLLVDRVNLICSLYTWWEGFRSSSLTTLPLGFNCGFVSTSACGLSTGVCTWGCPGGLGFAPVRARWGGGAAAWVAGVLAAPSTQGNWQPGQQEIQCSRRVWQPVLANMLQYSCLENPPPWHKPGRPQSAVHRVAKSQTWPKQPCVHRCKTFLPVAALPEWELSVKVVPLLGLRGHCRCQVCRDMDCLCRRSCGPIRVFFWASCSWWSEGLFGQSFSVALPIQALRGLPRLESFSIVWRVCHIEGPPWLGSYSVVQCIRCLMGQLLYCSAVFAGLWGERGYLWWWLHPLHVTQQHRLASMAAWLSSTGISHHSLFPYIPLIHLSAVNSSPRPGFAWQSLNSSSHPLCLLGDLSPWPGYVWLWQGLYDSHSI